MSEPTVAQKLEELADKLDRLEDSTNHSSISIALGDYLLFQYVARHIDPPRAEHLSEGLLLYRISNKSHVWINAPTNSRLSSGMIRLRRDASQIKHNMDGLHDRLSIYHGAEINLFTRGDLCGTTHIILKSPNIKIEDFVYAFSNPLTDQEALAELKKGENK